MAVGDAHVFPGFLTPVLTQLSFQSHRLLFSHASAEVIGENTVPERKFASTGNRTHNHQVMSPTRSPLSHPDGAFEFRKTGELNALNPFPNKPWFLRVCSTNLLKTQWEKEKLLVTSNFSFFHSVFFPFGELSTIFIKFEIVVCKLIWKNIKFVVRERVKSG